MSALYWTANLFKCSCFALAYIKFTLTTGTTVIRVSDYVNLISGYADEHNLIQGHLYMAEMIGSVKTLIIQRED